jgi:hypothetical protein
MRQSLSRPERDSTATQSSQSTKSGITFSTFLGDAAQLRSVVGIDLLPVAEGDRFERENSFTRFDSAKHSEVLSFFPAVTLTANLNWANAFPRSKRPGSTQTLCGSPIFAQKAVKIQA